MTNDFTFTGLVGAAGFILALAVLSYITLVTGSEVALGGIIAVAAGGKDFFLRGRVQPPTP